MQWKDFINKAYSRIHSVKDELSRSAYLMALIECRKDSLTHKAIAMLFKAMRVSNHVKLLACIRMITSVWIFEIVRLCAASKAVDLYANVSSLAFATTACEEFGQDDRVSPHKVVDSLWRIFYFWAEGAEISTILFALPSEKNVDDFRKLFEAAHPDIYVEWDKAAMFMEPRPGIRVLFVSNAQNGSYSAVVKIQEDNEDGSLPTLHIRLTTVRMNMVGRILGIVNCIDHTAFALARLSEMPQTKSDCITAAASLGLNTRSGRSYLSLVNVHDEL